MFSKVHLRASTHAFVYSVSSFAFPWVKILIPEYFSVKYTYILSLTALSFSGLKYLLMSLYFGFVCIFFPSRTCRVYRKYTFCHLKPFSSLFSTFSPHMHLLASDTWGMTSQNQERGRSLLLLTYHSCCPVQAVMVWPAQLLNFSHLPYGPPWWNGTWAYLPPKQHWLWTRLLRAWTSWKLKNWGMETAQPLGVTHSAASLSSLGNRFFHVLECGLMCAMWRGTIPYLDLWAVPLFVHPRSCRML